MVEEGMMVNFPLVPLPLVFFPCISCYMVLSANKKLNNHIVEMHKDPTSCTMDPPKAKPRAGKRKLQDTLAEDEGKKKKVSKKNNKKKAEKKNEDEGFVFSDTLLEGFDATEIDFSSTQIESLSDTLILKDYEKVYEPDNPNNDNEEEEAEEEAMEEESGGDPKPDDDKDNMKAKIEELIKINQKQAEELVVMKSSMEEMERVRKEDQLMQRGVINSLEEDKKVFKERLVRYIGVVPKMRKEIDDLKNAAKDNTNPSNNKGEVAKLKKALKESEEKVEKVTMDKVRIEAESKMVSRMNSNLEAMLSMFRGAGVMSQAEVWRAAAAPPVSPGATLPPSSSHSQDKDRDASNKKRKCYKYEKDQCSDSNCAFFHPTVLCPGFNKNGICRERSCQMLHRGEHRGDCHFWKQGDCKYSEQECGKGLHRTEMFDFYNQQGGQAQQQGGQGRQQGGQVAPPSHAPAPPTLSSAAAPSAPFFGGGQGGGAPPPGAMSREAMQAMVQYFSAQLSARGPGQQ